MRSTPSSPLALDPWNLLGLCLLLLLLLSCAELPADRPFGGSSSARPALGFDEVSHPAGRAWTWRADPRFEVVLVTAEDTVWAPGLLLVWKGHALASPGGLRAPGARPAPLFALRPPPGGADPLLSADDALVLGLAGAGGCEGRPVVVMVEPFDTLDQLEVAVDTEGLAALALPRAGCLHARTSGGEQVVHLDALAGGVLSLDGLESARLRDAPLADLDLWFDRPPPRARLEAGGGHVALDAPGACSAGQSLVLAW